MSDDRQLRRRVLSAFAASESVAEALLAYNTNVFRHDALPKILPLRDEPFTEAWAEYALECQKAGSILPLRKHLVQLQFPVEAGISQSPEYLAATRRGQIGKIESDIPGLREPHKCEVTLHQTLAGRIPVLFAQNREDFELLVRALSKRNEPANVPATMGACMIAGYNNWHRVRLAREAIEELSGTPLSETAWQIEFQKLIPDRERYQDRFIILSSGPYSGVPGEHLGVSEEAWLALSRTIRLEHECAHYVTKRLFGSMNNNMLDELIADFMGIVAARCSFSSRWFLEFLGIAEPDRSSFGRIVNYLAASKLPEDAIPTLCLLLTQAAQHVECFYDRWSVEAYNQVGLPTAFLSLTTMTLEELASERAVELLCDRARKYLNEVTLEGQLKQ